MKKIVFLTAAIFLSAVTAQAAEYDVKMISDPVADTPYYYAPDMLEIAPGDTVTFINEEEDAHNVVFHAVPEGASLTESPMMEQEGARWSHKFTLPGTYLFHCHPHAEAGMSGKIIVGAASAPEEMIMNGNHDHDHHSHEKHEEVETEKDEVSAPEAHEHHH